MISVFYAVLIIIISSIVGLAILKVISRGSVLDKWSGEIAIAPLAGAVSVMCISQMLAHVLTMRQISIAFILVLFICLLYLRADYNNIMRELVQHRSTLFIMLFIIIMLNYPSIMKGEMVSVHQANNDIMFYLSTMDWMQDHTILQTVSFTAESPYYVCAEYIFSNTRYGADVLGALMMSTFGLESYEIFGILGAVLSTMSSLVFYYFGRHVLKLPRLASIIILAIVGLNFGWVDLITQHYIPQIFGIGCLIGFTASLMKLYLTDKKRYIFLTALFLTGTATSYAEFAAYLVAIYIIVFGVMFFYRRTEKKTYLIHVLGAGVLSFVLNPIGMFIAVKFNLEILSRVSVSVSSIDAYSGNMKTFSSWVARALGSLDPLGITEGTLKNFYVGSLILLVVLAAALLVINIVKYRDRVLVSVLGILLFLLAYAAYFRSLIFAYGEHKHLVSIAPFLWTFAIYFIYNIVHRMKGRNWKLIGAAMGTTAIVISGFFSINKTYPVDQLYYFDSALMELEQAANLVPAGELIGLASPQYKIQHGFVYALKNHKVKQVIETNNSYFTIVQNPYDLEPTRYMVYDYSDIPREQISGDIIWSNNSMALVDHGIKE